MPLRLALAEVLLLLPREPDLGEILADDGRRRHWIALHFVGSHEDRRAARLTLRQAALLGERTRASQSVVC